MVTRLKPVIQRVQGHCWHFALGVYVATATKLGHRLQKPQNYAQLEDTPYHSPKLHPGAWNSVGMRCRTDRHTHSHTQTARATMHFAWLCLMRNVIKYVVSISLHTCVHTCTYFTEIVCRENYHLVLWYQSSCCSSHYGNAVLTLAPAPANQLLTASFRLQ